MRSIFCSLLAPSLPGFLTEQEQRKTSTPSYYTPVSHKKRNRLGSSFAERQAPPANQSTQGPGVFRGSFSPTWLDKHRHKH